MEKWGFESVASNHTYFHEDYEHFDTIVGVRDHCSLIESWTMPRSEEEDFDPQITPARVVELLQTPLDNKWMTFHQAFPCLAGAKYVIHFEYMVADLRQMAALEQLGPFTLPSIGSEWSSSREPPIWSPEAISYVSGRFGEEMELINGHK